MSAEFVVKGFHETLCVCPLHRDARGRSCRRPSTTSTLPSRAAPATPGPPAAAPVRDAPVTPCREPSEPRTPHTARAPLPAACPALSPRSPVPALPLWDVPPQSLLHWPGMPPAVTGSHTHLQTDPQGTVQLGASGRHVVSLSGSGTQLLPLVSCHPWELRLCFWLAQRDGDGGDRRVAQPVLPCLALSCCGHSAHSAGPGRHVVPPGCGGGWGT